MSKRLALLLSMLAGLALSQVAQAEVIELKVGNTTPASGNQSISATEFARRVNEQMAGKVHVTVFDNSQLGNEREMLQKLKIGTLDMSQPSTIMSTVSPEFGLFDMPYLIKDRAHFQRFLAEVFWKDIALKAEAKGYKIVAVYENGFRHITNNKRAINTPDDLKGIKIRIPRGVWRQKMFEAYGASPAPLEFNELFVALQSGVMDGQENPLPNIWGGKLNEVQKYLTLTNHVYTPSFLTAGLDRWNKLPADIRAQIEKIARETQPWAFDSAEKEDVAVLEKLKKAGIAVNTANRDSFVAASKSVYDLFGKEVPGGQALIDKTLALAK
ncbi:MAG: TRAP transporter substrate-binding protein [Pseudolabrys sp.]|nr:TRAP transporter substrate-binding protein [Pseudolabrys sp.]